MRLYQRGRRSRPISRVLSRTTIHLGCASPRTSSDLPGSLYGPYVPPQVRVPGTACFPIWSCSRRGLPCRRVLPPARCALTAPFHPYRPLRGLAVCFLLHFPWTHVPQVLPGALPWEPGLSSTLARSGCLADSGAHGGDSGVSRQGKNSATSPFPSHPAGGPFRRVRRDARRSPGQQFSLPGPATAHRARPAAVASHRAYAHRDVPMSPRRR